MFFHKAQNDGSVPLKYKRGKTTKTEYKSKCLGYRFRIPKDFTAGNEAQLEERSTPDNISDFWGQSASGIEVGVTVIPTDGSLLITDTDIIDRIGRATSQNVNDNSTDGRTSTYYGVTEFCGRKCAHSVMQYEQNGAELYAEFYQNYTTYYLLQFAFIYAKDKEFGVYDLKAAFSALGK